MTGRAGSCGGTAGAPECGVASGVVVRTAVPSDAEVVRAIAGETWRATYGGILEPEDIQQHLVAYYAVDALRRRIASREAEWLIGEMGGERVGFCSVLLVGREAEVVTLYVLPGSQRRGVGQAMLERAVGLAREKGVATVRVGYMLANRRAARFYAAAGFREVGRHKGPGGGVMRGTARLTL